MTRQRNPPLDAFCMPFTASRQFKSDSRMLVGAKGIFYQSDNGRDILDGTAGLWCCNAGHGYAGIADVVHDQLMTLGFAPTFQMGHPVAFEFANRLNALAPEGFDHVFFTGWGSESVDTTLKIALAYHRARARAVAPA